jgi:iron complex outermembrane receptor protein
MLAVLAVVMAVQDTMPAIVSVTRSAQPTATAPAAVSVVERDRIAGGRMTQGLDEALASVAGVYASNRYNFSLDQRISIRGFGARSSFGIRGIKVLLDGIPQTLPDGSGQLTNVELGAADRIEVLRGSTSALYGNASGGVISILTDAMRPAGMTEEARISGGDAWSKWLSLTRVPVGNGAATLAVSRLRHDGFRQHSAADLRNLNARYAGMAGQARIAITADYGDDPRADNPGALTAAELAANRDSAAAINLSRRAGKDVRQFQGGVSLGAPMAGGALNASVFGFTRRLRNPQTFAYIDLDRVAYGARASWTRGLRGAWLPTLVLGLDAQRQRDDRLNVGNNGGTPDTVRQLDQLEHVTELGPFAQLMLEPVAHWLVTAGVRYDWISFQVDDRLVTPSNPDDSGRRGMAAPSVFAGLTHRLNERQLVYANVGTSFETPTTTELANRPDTAGGFNPLLAPQHAVSVEFGARGTRGNLRYGFAAFQADVRDALIPYQIPAAPGRVFYRNAGSSRQKGVELEAGLALARWLRLDAAWNYSNFRYRSYRIGTTSLAGRALPGIPENWVHALWTIRPALARGAWLEIQQSYSSGYFVNDTLNVRTQPWHALDLRAGWEGNAGRLRLAPFAAVNNVLDRKYVSSVVINAANGRYYEPAPGRNVYAGLSVRFGG